MKAIFAVLAVMLLWSAGAQGCEPVKGYRIPFNFELVKGADLIVLARVRGGPARPEYGPPPAPNVPMSPLKSGVTLTPVQVLKGQLPKGKLIVAGVTSDRGKPVIPAFTKLTEAHPSSYEGACIRETYPIGGLVVAMFRNRSKGPAQLNYPFAREVEDVESENSVWVRAVRLYVRVLAQPAGIARRAALVGAERSLRSHRNDPGDVAIASDIRSYLSNHSLGGMQSMEPGGVPR